MIKKNKNFIFFFLLTPLIWQCGSIEKKSIPLIPEIKDGVSVFNFGKLSVDLLTTGNWSKPRKIKNGKIYRIAKYPGAALSFFAPKRETYMAIFHMREPLKFRMKINESWYLKPKDRNHLIIRKDSLKSGRNTLYIAVQKNKNISVEQIEIFPRRLANYRKKEVKNRILTPSRVCFYPNPSDGKVIKLHFDVGWIKTVPVKIVIQSEQKEIEEERVIGNTPLYLHLLDNSWHKISIDFPETKSRFITLKESLQLLQFSKPQLDPLPSVKKKINVLIILLDAARADHFGVYGYKRNTTPNIDKLSQKSLIFSNCYSEAAYTLASTATLLTGLPPDSHDVLFKFRKLSAHVTTLAQLFNKKGYFTACISANPFMSKIYNLDSGFEECIELFTGKKQVMAEQFINPFEKLITVTEKRPFFIYLHLREPHNPFSMPPPFLGTFQKKYSQQSPQLRKESSLIYKSKQPSQKELQLLTDFYDENIFYADFVVGKLLALLKKYRIFDKTIKIITSDHGEGLGEHGLIGHNVVLYKEGIHIPLIVSIPDYFPKRNLIYHPAVTSDIVVTLCQLFKLNYPYNSLTCGKNLFSLPKQRFRISRSFPAFNKYSRFMVEYSPYKLIFRLPLDTEFMRLYNIYSDPHEIKPLMGSDIPKETLIKLFENFMSVRKSLTASPINKLREKDIKNLKTLGYLD